MGINVPADHTVKLKESKKIDKYVDLGRELKQLRYMKVTVARVVVDAVGMIPKWVKKSTGLPETIGRTEIIPIKALLRSARILRIVR